MEDGLELSPEEWRKQSLERAVSLGYPPAIPLPIIDDFMEPRPAPRIIERFLALIGVVAVAFGLDRQKARTWLEREGAWSALTDEERTFIVEGSDDSNYFQIRTEALWALAWVLGLVDDLDFSHYCRDKFDAFVPNIWKDEDSARMRPLVRLRSFDEIATACDLACCLHWALRQAWRDGTESPGKLRAYVIWQRRRALEWVLSRHAWDDVPMDT